VQESPAALTDARAGLERARRGKILSRPKVEVDAPSDKRSPRERLSWTAISAYTHIGRATCQRCRARGGLSGIDYCGHPEVMGQ
jgi:hypothetical protein